MHMKLHEIKTTKDLHSSIYTDRYVYFNSFFQKVTVIHTPISNVWQYLFIHTITSNGAYCLFSTLIII